MKTLEQVLEFLDNIPNINSGGCGISALAVYKWLKKNDALSEDFAIVYLHRWDTYDRDTNRSFLKGENDNATACSHAIFRYNGVYYDSEGKNESSVRDDNSVIIPAEHVERFMKASLKDGNWNTSFNRAKGVKVIESNLGIELDVEVEEEQEELVGSFEENYVLRMLLNM